MALTSIIKQLQYYKSLGDKSFVQLEDQQLFWKPDSEANSIANIVYHLHGNMLSRWTDFLTSDGEKEWRNRDNEFEEVIENRTQLLEKWEAGWSCVFQALDQVNEDNIDQLVYIRNQGHTIMEAALRQLAHYAYHVGQIVLLARHLKGPTWSSLSIPRGKSVSYNQSKFSQPKSKKHFTDDLLEK